MHFPQPAKGFNLSLGTSILSVIFGCLTPKEDKEYVKELLGENVRYYQAWKQKMDHGLEIIPEDEWEGRMNFYNREKDISQFGG